EKTMTRQLEIFHQRALPDLAANIKCGNSLIGPDYFTARLLPDPEELRCVNPFDWQAQFPEAMKSGGFDCLIGNPPWGAQYSVGEKDYLRNAFAQVHVRTPESFNYFIAKARGCISKDGVVGVIIPSSFLTQHEFWKARKAIVEPASIFRVCNLGDGVFPRVTAPCCVLIFGSKRNAKEAKYIDLRRTNRATLASLLMKENGAVAAPRIGLDSDSFLLLVRPGLHVIQKCYAWPRLKEVVEDVATGISSGLDIAYVFDSAHAGRLRLEHGLLRKLIVGSEIHRYCAAPQSGKKIIYATAETRIEKYPNCCAALLPHRDRLKKRREAANGKIPWFALNWPRREKLFEKTKILIRQTSDRILAAIDTEQWYCLKSAIIVQIKDGASISYSYLLGLLNSRLMAFLYDDLVGEQTRVFPEVKPVQLFKLPIRTMDLNDPSDKARHDRMVALVEQMLELHKRLHAADIRAADSERYQRQIAATDCEIDRIVYDLYGLTEDEIRIVNESK
ncbi:MAG: N-6 DNA methylase, partial [Candidatus Sumerlaeota bacterium]|nr:N-6 DNA methylase [Candidatus Sumerlaeota bacterium]